MIGSFWNLCRACPSMPVDKQLHSEYRSTYRWHEFTGSARPAVVRRAPVPNPNQFAGATNEPPLPRRKKCPELAYKSHEFIIGSEYTDARNNVANRMPRSEERNGTPSRRSKSEGPSVVPNGHVYPTPAEAHETDSKQAATLHELEPLVSDADDSKSIEKQVTFMDRKVTARPFTQLLEQEKSHRFITKKADYGFDEDSVVDNKQQQEQQHKETEDTVDLSDLRPALTKKEEVVLNGSAPPHSKPNLDLWLKEVIELRKKADEYKCRGWGIEIDPELYKNQKDLWEQVSKNSSLSALSLASAMHRPITKEEKEQENNKKTVPVTIKAHRGRVPGQALFFDNKDEIHALPARFSYMRHHLERTTGPDVEEGALLPSPTREKLMPAIMKRDSISQRGSPKKTAPSRHGSPQKGSPQKGSPKKVIKSDTEDVRDTAISVSSYSSQPPTTEVAEEPLVKSPPEPTRVKSPEQIIMRSPDPVNWTVPLDTGKTFTVTQNVKEGEIYSRPQSEIKASTPIEKPPPPPQSAPPELTEQVKMDVWKNAETTTVDRKTSLDNSSSASDLLNKSSLINDNNGFEEVNTGNNKNKKIINGNNNNYKKNYNKFIKSLPGTTIRVLEDPLFDIDVVMASTAALKDAAEPEAINTTTTTPSRSPRSPLPSPSSLLSPLSKTQSNSLSTMAPTTYHNTASTTMTANDVLEKARDRFERFWGGANKNAKEERV